MMTEDRELLSRLRENGSLRSIEAARRLEQLLVELERLHAVLAQAEADMAMAVGNLNAPQPPEEPFQVIEEKPTR